MVGEETGKKVTAIVPAYNEAQRIGAVLSVLTTYPGFYEVIVVDDGSTDRTEEITQKYSVRYIRLSTNQGKGHAMDIAVSLARTDIILFIDADISGLTHTMVTTLVEPVLDGTVDMFIAMRNRKIYALHNIMVFVPLLGGERAITKKLWQMLPPYYKRGFRIEAGLNFYAQYYGKGYRYTIIKGLSQVIKEKKYGLIHGLRQRIGMVADLTIAQLKLQVVNVPKSTKNTRLQAIISLQSLFWVALGAAILAAIHYGPYNFVLRLFSEELREDPTAPLVHYLLIISRSVAVDALAIISVALIAINLLIFILTAAKISHLFSGIAEKAKSQKNAPYPDR